MKRKWMVWFLTLCCAFCFFACNKEENTSNAIVSTVEATEENRVVIKVVSADGAFLLDVMRALQSQEEMTFTADATNMITSINGKENPANWSACWMLYTSDTDFSNEAYGTCVYKDVTYKSAVLGAESLPVINGGYYIWVYTSF